MGRPRKPDADKLIAATTYLTQSRYDRLQQLARARGVPMAVVLREYLDPAFRIMKNVAPPLTP